MKSAISDCETELPKCFSVATSQREKKLPFKIYLDSQCGWGVRSKIVPLNIVLEPGRKLLEHVRNSALTQKGPCLNGQWANFVPWLDNLNKTTKIGQCFSNSIFDHLFPIGTRSMLIIAVQVSRKSKIWKRL